MIPSSQEIGMKCRKQKCVLTWTHCHPYSSYPQVKEKFCDVQKLDILVNEMDKLVVNATILVSARCNGPYSGSVGLTYYKA